MNARACDRMWPQTITTDIDIRTQIKSPPQKLTNHHEHTVGYHASTSNHISGSEDLSFAKLPYPVPFKSATEQHPPQQQHNSGHTSLDSQSPVNVGGQAAYDFISSYEAPASHDNSLSASTVFSGSAPNSAGAGHFGGGGADKGPSSSAVETLREILNKNIPYSDANLLNTPHNKPIEVEFSDQTQHHQFEHPQQQHDTTFPTHNDYLPPSGYGELPLNNNDDHKNHYQEQVHHPSAALELPHQTENHHQHNNYQQSGADSNPVQQYEIPPDPRTYVPAFRPLSKAVGPPFMRYGAPPIAVLPVQSVYQAHSIHTAYGPPSPKYFRPAAGTNNGGGHGGLGPVGGGSGYKYNVPNRPGNAYLPVLPPSHQTGPYNRRTVFGNINKMHGKRSSVGFMGTQKNRAHAAFNGGGGGLPGPARLAPPPQLSSVPGAIVVADQQPEHEHQLQRLQDSLGVDIEVQKSISIELDGKGNPKQSSVVESPSSISGPIRRSSLAEGELTPPSLPLATGPNYSRPYSKRRLTPKKYTFHRF